MVPRCSVRGDGQRIFTQPGSAIDSQHHAITLAVKEQGIHEHAAKKLDSSRAWKDLESN